MSTPSLHQETMHEGSNETGIDRFNVQVPNLEFYDEREIGENKKQNTRKNVDSDECVTSQKGRPNGGTESERDLTHFLHHPNAGTEGGRVLRVTRVA